MERNQMQEILKEQGFQQSGACTDEACLVEMGQMLGVKVLVVGSLGKLGSMFMVNIRSIDVQTAQIMKVVSVDIKGDIEEVVDHLPEIAVKLTGAANAEPVAAVQQSTPPEPAAAPDTAPPPAPAPTVEASPPVEKADDAVVDSKLDRNKNRGGIGVSITILPGGFRHTAVEKDPGYVGGDSTFNDLIYLLLDSTTFSGRSNYYELIGEDYSYNLTSSYLADYLVRFKIRAGGLFTVDVGPHFLYGSETWDYTGTGSTSQFVLTYMSIGAQVGLNFVKRIFPLKINAGIFADVTVPIIAYEYSEEYYDTFLGYDTWTDSDARIGFKVVPGARAGAEILAGPHIGFSVDFVFQYLVMRDVEYDFDEMDIYNDDADNGISQSVGFPMFGLGLGVNFYF
jgi:hypothetical protein